VIPFCCWSFLVCFLSYLQTRTIFLSDDDKPKETAVVVLPPPTSAIVEKNSQEEAAVEIPPEDTLEKIMKVSALKHRKKAMHTASVSLEVHQDASSSSDVSTPYALLFYGVNSFTYTCSFYSLSCRSFYLLALNVSRFESLSMNPRVHICISFVFLLLSSLCCL
jgi:hypothetical protein